MSAHPSKLPAVLLVLFLALVAGGLMYLNGLVQDPMLPGERVPVIAGLAPHHDGGASRIALMFVSPVCPHCLQALERISVMPAAVLEVLTVVAAGSEEEAGRLRGTFPLRIVADPDGAAAHAFRNNIVPSLYLIDEDGILRHRPNIVMLGTAESLQIVTFLTGSVRPGNPGGGPQP